MGTRQRKDTAVTEPSHYRFHELLAVANTLRAAALYIEQHGYYIPIERVEGNDPDFDWDSYDEDDNFDKSSPTPLTPAASEYGAIAMAVYGWPNRCPVDDGSTQYRMFCEALSYLGLMYAPDGYGYGDWIFPFALAEALRSAANDCEYDAHHPLIFEIED
jgi:hypothetical protein